MKAFGQDNSNLPEVFIMIGLCCKDFAITVYFLSVSFLIDAFNSSSKRIAKHMSILSIGHVGRA